MRELNQGIKYRKVRLKKELGGEFVELGEEKTFFPDDWDEEEIIDAIKSAFDSRQDVLNETYKIGTYNGFRIRLLFNSDGSFKTAFPEI